MEVLDDKDVLFFIAHRILSDVVKNIEQGTVVGILDIHFSIYFGQLIVVKHHAVAVMLLSSRENLFFFLFTNETWAFHIDNMKRDLVLHTVITGSAERVNRSAKVNDVVISISGPFENHRKVGSMGNDIGIQSVL